MFTAPGSSPGHWLRARASTARTADSSRSGTAIVDGLRKQSNLPRRVWAKLVALRAASEYLENRAERDAILPGSETRWRFQVAQSREIIDEQIRELQATVPVTIVLLDACRDNPFALKGKRSIGLTRSLSLAGAPHGIHVNTVLPSAASP